MDAFTSGAVVRRMKKSNDVLRRCSLVVYQVTGEREIKGNGGCVHYRSRENKTAWCVYIVDLYKVQGFTCVLCMYIADLYKEQKFTRAWCVYLADPYKEQKCTCAWCVYTADPYKEQKFTCAWCVYTADQYKEQKFSCEWCVYIVDLYIYKKQKFISQAQNAQAEEIYKGIILC